MQTKIKILTLVFVAIFAFLVIKLGYWQIIKGSDLSSQARAQQKTSSVTSAPRGNILASDGSYWVIRTNSWLLYADSTLIDQDAPSVAKKITPILVSDLSDRGVLEEGGDNLSLEEAKITGLLSKKGSWIPLETKLSGDAKRNIEALDIRGLNFQEQEDRFYPEASSAAQLLGFVGKDVDGNNIGYFGLEGYYNLPLSGKPGYLGGQKDAHGNPILIGGSKEVDAISGVNLVTSIDKRMQLLAEQKLKEGIEKYGAVGGSVSIINPKTGEIMAMASDPSFDPADYGNYGDKFFKNPVISDTFEPGSIFKVLVMAAGLDAKVVKPDTECDICAGPLKIDKYFIKTWNEVYHPDITMTDVIVDSDNVGMSFVGDKLGADKMYDYLSSFGIGKLTGIDLQGEATAKLREKGTWNVVDLATASFGQGVAVTGIQMLRAVSAIANGGYLVAPHVVTAIEGEGWKEELNVDEPKRIIGREAASETAQMMVEAANRGEAKWTKVPGFNNVAGKTGTAQIPVSGHYDTANTNHSFIGFAPAADPKFVMLVTLRSPQSSPWAAETAAPLWFSIAKELFPYLGIQPS